MRATVGSSSLEQGQIVNGTYRIQSLLGEGAMGRVYRAHQISLDRVVALKILRLDKVPAQQQAEMETRFSLEASMCSQLAHPNIVTVFDHGRITSGPSEGACFIAMEYLDGETLGEWIRSQRLTLKLTLRFAMEIAQALHEAHESGVVHRDLKPENVMLVRRGGEPAVKLVDFGLVRGVGARAVGLTAAGAFLGTPAYMAPEQIQRAAVDSRTDLYSFGAVLFECITGRLPFESDDLMAIAVAHLQARPASFQATNPRVTASPALERLVMQLLEKDPAKRPQTAEDVLRRLRETPEAEVATRSQVPVARVVRTAARYQLGAELSRRGGSIVFDATHVELGRKVVLKVFASFEQRDTARLTREVLLLAQLKHPNLARILDTGTMLFGGSSVPFVVSDRVVGETLTARLARASMSAAAVLELGAGLAEALSEAHRLGLIHGAIEPEHVILPADRSESAAVLMGFRSLSAAARLSGISSALDPRRISYHAPELGTGGRLTERTDIFALGAMLHECLTGKPYAGAVARSAGSTAEEDVLRDLLPHALARSPGERFETSTALASAFRNAIRRTGPDSARRSSLTSAPKGRAIWVLGGDPAMQRPAVVEALSALRGSFDIEEVRADDTVERAKALAEGTIARPAVVLFGDLNVILEDPVLQAVRAVRSISRLLISTHLNVELLQQSVNFCGVDQHVCLPATAQDIVGVATDLLARTHEVRRRLMSETIEPFASSIVFAG
jgi:serine/threonine protein kinase